MGESIAIPLWIAEEFRLMNAQSIVASNYQMSHSPSNHHSPGNFQFHDPTLHQPPPHFLFQPIHPPPDLSPPSPPYSKPTVSLPYTNPPYTPFTQYTNMAYTNPPGANSSSPQPQPFVSFPYTQPHNSYYQPNTNQFHHPYTVNPYYQEPLSNARYTLPYYPEYQSCSTPLFSSIPNQTPTTIMEFEERDQVRTIVEKKLGLFFDPVDWCVHFDEIMGMLLERYPELRDNLSSPSPSPPSPTQMPQVFVEIPLRGVDSCEEHIGPGKTEVLQGEEHEFEHPIEEIESPVASTNYNSVNDNGSTKVTQKKFETLYEGTLVFVIDRKMKEHTDNLMHAVEGLSTRLSQLDCRKCYLENSLDELKESVEYSHKSTDGKLRQLENMLREVQGGVLDLRDKQEIAEAQLQLAMLQVSKCDPQSEKKNKYAGTHLVQLKSSYASQESHKSLPNPVTVSSPNHLHFCALQIQSLSSNAKFMELQDNSHTHKVFDLMPESNVSLSNKFIQMYFSHDPYYNSFLFDIPPPRPPSQPPDISSNHENPLSLVCKSPQTHLLYTILSFIILQIHRHSENIKAAIVFGNYVFGSALGACQESGPSSLQLGMQIHGLILKTRYALDAVVCNVLISMYGNCSGSAECARRAFDGIVLRNSNSWNSMVSIYSQRGHAVSAFDLFSRMQREGSKYSLRPNEYTFGSSVTAACSLIDTGLSLLEQMLTKVEKSGFLKDLFVGSALVSGFSKFGSIGYAKKILEQMSVRNAVSMNGFMVGLVRQKRSEEATEVFMEMKDLVGVNLDSYVILLSALAEFAVLEDGRKKGKEVHAYLVRTHLSDIKVATGNGLVNRYAKYGAIHEACSVFRLMVDKDSVSWNSLISDQNECFEDAIISFRTVRRTGLMPTNFTLVSTLSSCGSSGLSMLGVQIHCEGVKLGLDLDVSVSNALLVVYAGTGCFKECQKVFLLMSEYDQVSWNSVIGALADSEKSVSEAVGYFLGMMRAGWSLNRITFINILTAVSPLLPLELGHQIHALVLKHCVDNDIAIENALLSFNGKCDEMADCKKIFARMSERRVDILETLRQLTQAPSWSWWIVMKASVFKMHHKRICNLGENMGFSKFKLEDKLTFEGDGMLRSRTRMSLLWLRMSLVYYFSLVNSVMCLSRENVRSVCYIVVLLLRRTE